MAPAAADEFGSSTAVQTLAAVAAARTRSGLGGVMIVIGLAALLPGLALVVSRVDGRGTRLATIGGALTMVGVVAGSVTNTFYFASFALTDPDLTISPAAAAVAYTAMAPVILPFFICYGIGTVFGFAVLGIAAFRSGRVPRWAAVVLGLTGPGFVVVDGIGVIGGVVTSLMLLVGLQGCGVLRAAKKPAASGTSLQASTP